MMSSNDFLRNVSGNLLLRALVNFTGRADVQLLLDGAEARRATTGIEGFTSIVVRVLIPYRFDGEEEIHRHTFIVKALPHDEYQLGLVQSSQFFAREGTYLDRFLPAMFQVSMGRVPVPIPVCYGASYGGVDDAIVMEDLGGDGFRTPSRRFHSTGLDSTHCDVAMEALGRLHALSLAAEGEVLSHSTKGWLETFPLYGKDSLWFEYETGGPKPFFHDYADSMISTILMLARQMDDIPQDSETFDVFEGVLRGMVPTLCKLVKPNKDGRNIVTHGDCWMNNMMFRYEKDDRGVEIPVDAKFIDFQITRYCHPCIDLLYFFNISVSKSLTEECLDKMIGRYYSSMTQSLSSLGRGQPPMSLEEFREDFFGQYMPYGAIIRILLYPMMLLGDDFAPSEVDYLTPEKCEEFVKTGNSSAILSHFQRNVKFRLQIEEIVRDFANLALSGALSTNSS